MLFELNIEKLEQTANIQEIESEKNNQNEPINEEIKEKEKKEEKNKMADEEIDRMVDEILEKKIENSTAEEKKETQISNEEPNSISKSIFDSPDSFIEEKKEVAVDDDDMCDESDIFQQEEKTQRVIEFDKSQNSCDLENDGIVEKVFEEEEKKENEIEKETKINENEEKKKEIEKEKEEKNGEDDFEVEISFTSKKNLETKTFTGENLSKGSHTHLLFSPKSINPNSFKRFSGLFEEKYKLTEKYEKIENLSQYQLYVLSVVSDKFVPRRITRASSSYVSKVDNATHYLTYPSTGRDAIGITEGDLERL